MNLATVDPARNLKSVMAKANKNKGTNFGPFIFKLILLFPFCSAISMEVPAGMTLIKRTQEVIPFAGKMVAFMINLKFNKMKLKYGYFTPTIIQNVHYGIKPSLSLFEIVPKGMMGYFDMPVCYFRINCGLAIRLASNEEFILVYQNIRNKNDYFTGFTEREEAEALRALEIQSGFELQKKKIS